MRIKLFIVSLALCVLGAVLPARAADLNPDDPLAAMDLRAYDLWALGAGLAQGMLQRQKVCAL